MMKRIEGGIRRKGYKGGIRTENNENKAGNYKGGNEVRE